MLNLTAIFRMNMWKRQALGRGVTVALMCFVSSSIVLAAPPKVSTRGGVQMSGSNKKPSLNEPTNTPDGNAEVRVTSADESGDGGFQRFRYDLGMSTGTSRGKSFYEINLGLEFFPLRFLSWRNAPFLRFQSGENKNYGIDTSLRGNYDIGLDKLGVDVHGGAGYRFQNLRSHVPLAEGGGGIRLGGIRVGANIKALFYGWVDSGASHEIVYTLSASGGGGF